jgi:hypothetical protein
MASIKAERARLLDGLRQIYAAGTVLIVGLSSVLSIGHKKGHLK